MAESDTKEFAAGDGKPAPATDADRRAKFMKHYTSNGGNISQAARKAGYSESYIDTQPSEILKSALNYQRKEIQRLKDQGKEVKDETLGFSREELVERTRELHEQDKSPNVAWKVNKALHRKHGTELGEQDNANTQAVQVNIEVSDDGKEETVQDTIEVENNDDG